MSGSPHEVLLVLDATTGQNAVSQAKLFNEAIGVTGIALTKLDGTAKGGIIVAITREFGIPSDTWAWRGGRRSEGIQRHRICPGPLLKR